MKTFSNAIREKYEDLYFEEDLLVNLFDAVNGRRPVAGRRYGRTNLMFFFQCFHDFSATSRFFGFRGTPRSLEREHSSAVVLAVEETEPRMKTSQLLVPLTGIYMYIPNMV